MKRSALFLLALLAVCVMPSFASAQAQKLLIERVISSPTPAEMVSIRNPGTTAVDLSNYYLSDCDQYFRVVTSTPPVNNTDFIARFPAGASIAAGQTIYVSIGGAVCFNNACGSTGTFTGFGFNPDYEFASATAGNNSPTVPDMVAPFTGAIGASKGLTNTAEPIILFYWNGTTPLVTDVDFVYFLQPPLTMPTTANPFVNKSPPLTINGAMYNPDAVWSASEGAPLTTTGIFVTCRVDQSEGTQVLTGGNGISGRDEISENTAMTFAANPATPDTDGDGIGDACDMCPTVAGSAANLGCGTPVVVDAGVDAGVDAAADVPVVDVPVADVPADIPVVDTGVDVPVVVDTGVDVPVVVDTGVDSGVDAGVDATHADVPVTDTATQDAATDTGPRDGATDAARTDAAGDARADAVGADNTTVNPRGCGCTTPGSHRSGGLASLAIAAIALAFARRRRAS